MREKTKLMSDIRFLTEEIDKKENPIQANPVNPLNRKVDIEEPNVPEDKEADKIDLLAEIFSLEKTLKENI